MTKRKIIWIYCFILLYSFGPLLGVFLACGIASATGSRLDESGVHPCIIHGVDYGGALLDLFVCGFFMFLTIPTGLLAMLIFTVVLLIRRHLAKRAAHAITPVSQKD